MWNRWLAPKFLLFHKLCCVIEQRKSKMVSFHLMADLVFAATGENGPWKHIVWIVYVYALVIRNDKLVKYTQHTCKMSVIWGRFEHVFVSILILFIFLLKLKLKLKLFRRFESNKIKSKKLRIINRGSSMNAHLNDRHSWFFFNQSVNESESLARRRTVEDNHKE